LDTAKCDLFNTLKEVYDEENARFVYVPDQIQYRVPDKWVQENAIPNIPEAFRGDCEDFALACRKNLRNRGINNSRLVLCLTEEKEYHVVLEIKGWVFDCRQSTIVPRDELRYGWIMISGYDSGDSWSSLV
jgi:predicted transglutaminase-like cysteine proteinase